MQIKTILLYISTLALLSVTHVLAACGETGAICNHNDECCSGACSPVFNYCLPQ
ncbi:Conotoxin-like protein 2 [Perigonia lusca single nucleopolyhedrovirus]|uniref:Conotoxin-like protein 2 n=1 Tax=Perigonia lusca single nucleopolyhedrovirus TaxID=1675865 RepID=A0A0M3WN55_9ABAC|nr:Conotoxin-like protein 2 [Perigonia lusca single nucleopolyhedrovirus]AKN80601.1 Conotoxin-like protein 2 [Perigonia lusca single nucleopolyhedrovirus]